jgi:diguanylate cyclase (GGDEF)-like protein
VITTGEAHTAMSVRSHFNALITGALALVLCGMGGFAIFGVVMTQRATDAVHVAEDLNDQYQQARYWVGAEESLERKYRLEPGPDVLAAHRAAESALTQNMHHVIQVGTSADQAIARSILTDHIRYEVVAQLMFAAVDAGDVARVNQIDDTQDDPIFGKIQDMVNAQAIRHHTNATQQLAALQQLQSRTVVADPIIFVIGCLLLAVLWRMLYTYRRRVDELHQNEVARLAEVAFTDSLTHLGNHRAYQEEVQSAIHHAVEHETLLNIALIDIDEFKMLNDQQGHAFGDKMLVALGRLMCQVGKGIRAFRLGGDTFAFLMPRMSVAEAQQILEDLRAAAPGMLQGATVSIGLATLTSDHAEMATLQEQADAALHEAKRRGRNTLVAFDDVRDQIAIVSSRQIQALHRLLEEQMMRVVFQPIWDLPQKRLYAVEALSRPDPASGFAGPQEMFDTAEQIGHAHELDTLCRHAILKQAGALNLPDGTLLFMNVSPQTLDHQVLQGTTLLDEVAAAGLAPEQVVLEITERSISRLNVVIREVARLREMGFKIALDDTGAGNAGLEMLSSLPVDYVKIDRGVLVKAQTDASARGVLAGIIAIARETRSYVIAEGIEDAQMLAMVQRAGRSQSRGKGVQGVQGYLLGRPAAQLPESIPPELGGGVEQRAA